MAQGVTYDGTPLMITNVGDEPIEVSLRFNALRKTEPPIIYYNTTGKKSYKKWDLSSITLAKGGTLYLFGENSVVDSTFVVNGNSSIHLDGKLEALLQGQVGTAQFGNYALEGLFKNVTQLESVGDIMPQVIGGVNAPSSWSDGYRYSSLFENTGIVEIPNNFLKETALGAPHLGIYRRMFFGCTKLTTIPRDLFINQSSSFSYSYQSMFQNCSNLEVAADVYCKSQSFMTTHSMYRGCKKITDVKVFTKTLASNHCMQYFVADCDNLQSIDFDINRVTHWGALANAMLNCKNLTKVSIKVKTWNHEQTSTTHGAYYYWMTGVSPTGTFTCTKELAEATDGYYDEEGNFVKGVGRGVDTVLPGWYIDYPIIDARDGDDTNATALMAVISQQAHTDGTPWVKDGLVMMKSEAEKVKSIGNAFTDNTLIANFDVFKFFTSVTSLFETAFQGCTSLESIIIPRNVSHIGGNSDWSANGTFNNCTSLRNVVFDEGSVLTTFYGRTFCGTLIERIELPDTITRLSHAFRQAAHLAEITIPPLITSLINASFLNASKLEKIRFSSKLTTIQQNAFAETPAKEVYFEGTIDDWIENNYGELRSRGFTLYINNEQPTHITIDKNPTEGYIFTGQKTIEEIVITDNVTSLGNAAFNSCTNLENVTLGNGLTSIPAGGFDGCSKLKDVVFPNSLKTIGSTAYSSGAFRGCTSFTKVEIPDSVELIGSFAFRNCTGIKSVVIGNGQLHICSMAFGGCSSLETVDIGSGVYQIDGDIFWGCSKLNSVIIRALVPPIVDANAIDELPNIYVPDDSVAAYKAADIWSNIAGRIKPISELPQ